MNLKAMIGYFRDELRKVERVIAAIEDLQTNGLENSRTSARGRRGRKFMNAEERREVSERMKRYWAKRQRMNR